MTAHSEKFSKLKFEYGNKCWKTFMKLASIAIVLGIMLFAIAICIKPSNGERTKVLQAYGSLVAGDR